ncbi:hypothetical protein ACFORG_17845 [Lutimaribacter marinistellae]|uniref:Resolvase n=1 Tax=Lutimaribacter marinistellae TaxID=1820329 RepID=A0ABV7TM73_9RHOB
MLAVAVRRDLACMMYLQGKTLKDWRVSHKAARSPGDGVSVLRTWMAIYEPDVVICQNPDSAGRKSARNILILTAMARVISDADVLDLLVTRRYAYRNIYEEAAMIARRYPALKQKLPKKPRIWETEPRRIIYFEAMALALAVLDEQ